MHHRNPKSPWNPAIPVTLSPEDYERQVVEWLKQAGPRLTSFEVLHQAKLRGSSGAYAFDAIAEFEIFEGARIIVLVECKRHSTPVKRDHILALEAKRQDVGAHKAMLFSTGGFQRSALEYAAKRGIATITFIDGRLIYETRASGFSVEPPPWAKIPRYAGWFIYLEGGSVRCSLIDKGHLDILNSWLRNSY